MRWGLSGSRRTAAFQAARIGISLNSLCCEILLDMIGEGMLRCAILLAIALSHAAFGCVSENVLIQLKPDGSGALKITYTLQKSLLEMFKVTYEKARKELPNTTDDSPRLLESLAKDNASKIGEGV